MKKLFNWIRTDGWLHMAVCAAITLSLGYFVNFGLAAFISILIGFLKEIVWDAKMGKGAFEWHDIICDIIGAVLAVGVVALGTYL